LTKSRGFPFQFGLSADNGGRIHQLDAQSQVS
jgi:hypothetical protein